MIKNTLLCYSFLIIFPLVGFGQNQEFTKLDLNHSISDQLPPLDALIEMAIRYHPTIKYNEELEGVAAQRIKLEKGSWASLLSGYVDYSTGNQSLIVTGMQNNDVNNLTTGYRAGLNLNFPLSQLTNRKARIKVLQQELSANVYKTQEMEIEIARQVVEEYNAMVTGQQLMRNEYEMVKIAQSNFQIAELEYKSGNMEGAIFIRSAEVLNIAKASYENAKKDFSIALQKLELLIGAPFSLIIQ